MKIKRTTGGATKQAGGGATATGAGATATKATTVTDTQHEIVKAEQKAGNVNNSASGGEASGGCMPSPMDKFKQQPSDKDKKCRGAHKKERKDKNKDGHVGNAAAAFLARILRCEEQRRIGY